MQAFAVFMLLFSLLTLLPSAKGNVNWYLSHWCGGSLEYLEDSNCVKQFPSKFDRDSWACPVIYDTNLDGYSLDTDYKNLSVDTETLNSIISVDVNLCVVLTKRVQSESSTGVELYHKYFCNGDDSVSVGHETWSSSKIFAMINAAGHLRSDETSCSASEFGLDSTTLGKHGVTPLGDLATVVTSYDTTAGYSSNSLSSYFHDLGFRDRINDLVVDWLGAGPGQSLGGNYGEATPSDLKFTLTSESSEQCTADKDPWPVIHTNTISALTALELTRRIAQHREIPDSFRFPGVTWEDVKTILYGEEHSVLFPGLQWGGMSTDTAIFIQNALNMTTVENESQGNFRIFSKLGCGWSTSRYVGEIVSNSYACLPKLDAEGNAIANVGVEFTLHVRGSRPNDSSLVKVQNDVVVAVNEAVSAILSGIIA